MFWRSSSNSQMQTMTPVTNRRASAPARATRSKSLIIDVDDLAEERARRRSMKKRVSILFNSFRRHSTMTIHKDASHSEGDSSHTWDLSHSQSHSHDEDRGIIQVKKLLPHHHDPFRAAEAAFLVSSSSASLSSMSDHHEEEDDLEQEDLPVPVLSLATASASAPATSGAARFVVHLGTALLLYKILSKRYPRKIKRRVSFATLPTEDLCDVVEPVPHIPFLPPKSLPKDLTMEIVLFRRPLVVKPVRPPFNPHLSHEILRFNKNLLKAQATKVATAAKTTNNDNTSSTDLVALQQKCADLSKITELLSKQLVQSTLNKTRDTKLQRKEALTYQQALRKLEEQHRAQCAALLSDKKYLEGQLRHCKVETVPPTVKSPDTYNNKKKQQQQHKTFMDDLKEPVQICLRSPMSPTVSFSMASTMILQNKLLPALLSAVARANVQQ